MKAILIICILLVQSVFAQKYDYPKATINAHVVSKKVDWEPIEASSRHKKAKWVPVETSTTELSSVFTELAYEKVSYTSAAMIFEDRTYVSELFYKDNSTLDIRYLDLAHGLFSNLISEIVEMPDGRMMIVGLKGLGIYNGAYIDLFIPPKGFEFIDVHGCSVSDDGKIWLATKKGLFYWYENKLYKLNEFGQNGCWSVEAIGDKVLVGEYDSGFYSIENGAAKRFWEEDLMVDARDYDLDSKGDLWIASHHGFIKQEQNKWFSYDYFSSTSPVCAVREYDGRMYIGTWGDGLYKLEDGSLYRLEESSSKTAIYDFEITAAGLWITYYGSGMGLLDNKGHYFRFEEQDGLTGDGPYKITKDRFGNLWTAHLMGGISVFRETRFKPSIYEPLDLNMKGMVAMDSVAYYFSPKQNIKRRIGNQYTELRYEDDIKNLVLNGGDLINPHEMWIYSFGEGIAHYKSDSIHFYQDTSYLYANMTSNVHSDRYGRVWFSDYFGDQRFLYQDSLYQLKHVPELAEIKVYDAFHTFDRQVLISTDLGLLIPGEEKIRLINQDHGLLSNTVLAICNNRHGEGVWVLTKNGLNLMVGAQVKRTIKSNNLSKSNIVTMSQVDRGFFIAKSDKNLFELHLDGDELKIKKLGREYGQYLREVGVLELINDTIRLIQNSHVYDFLKYWNGSAQQTPSIRFPLALVDGEEVAFPIRLAQKEELTLKFDAVNWAKEQIIEYRINNGNWNELSQPKLVLSELSNGEYTIQLRVSNEYGASEMISFEVKVPPYWYQTTWFMFLCICLAILIVSLIFRYRVRLQKKKAKELELIVDQKTSEISVQKKELEQELYHNALLLKEVHHRVKNNIQMISGILELQLSKTENPDYQNALKIATDRIKTVSISHQDLYLRENYESLYIADYFKSIAAHIQTNSDVAVNIDIPDDYKLPIETAQILGLTFNELLTNALKHAWSEDHVNKKVFVRLEKTEDQTQLIVKDNGSGITMDQSNTNSIGMLLVKGFVQRHFKGSIEFKSNNGTEVTIKFPNHGF